MQFKSFRTFVEEKEGDVIKCDKCGVIIDPNNQNRTARTLEDPSGGIAGTYCTNCFESKQKQMKK